MISIRSQEPVYAYTVPAIHNHTFCRWVSVKVVARTITVRLTSVIDHVHNMPYPAWDPLHGSPIIVDLGTHAMKYKKYSKPGYKAEKLKDIDGSAYLDWATISQKARLPISIKITKTASKLVPWLKLWLIRKAIPDFPALNELG